MNIPNSIKLEVDYLLRKKTNYSLSEFIGLLDHDGSSETFASNEIDNLLRELGSCNDNLIPTWLESSISSRYQDALLAIKSEGNLYGLPHIARKDEFLLREFNRKIDKYESLPHQEVDDLNN
ncbi:hypothetical protein ACWXWU_11080 [Shewanella sp. A14]